MAARATRSASRKARRAEEAVATGPLGALSHDELGVIFDGLADPLQPVVAVALSSTCMGMRTPLAAALKVLEEQHKRAVALCRRYDMSCAEMCREMKLDWKSFDRTVVFDVSCAATLGMILRRSSLPTLRELDLGNKNLGDAGVQALFEGLGPGSLPSLCDLSFDDSQVGPAGAEALAAAIRRGAMPKLEGLLLDNNPLGNQSLVALAPALQKLPLLGILSLWNTGIGDEAVTSLVSNLGKDAFKALEIIDLDHNKVTDKGCATLVSAIKAGALPSLTGVALSATGDDRLVQNPASEAAMKAVEQALEVNRQALEESQ